MTPAAKKRLIAQLARQRGLDPAAVLAVASVEGSFRGAIGDNGTSFGPFQLHWGGAMPSQFRGDAKASQQWANSRAGITYAVDQIAKVARGRKGKDAIAAIVHQFERPAAPGAEVEKAWGRYGNFVGAGRGAAQPRQTAPNRGEPAQALAGASMQSMLAAQLLAQASQTAQGQLGDPSALMGLALLRQQAMAAEQQFGPAEPAHVPEGGGKGPTSARYSGTLAELFHDPLGGIKHGKEIGAIGGHDRHVHIALKNPRAMRLAIKKAQKMGLAVRENPLVDPVERVHTGTSYHYRNFGKSNIGMAADISGDPRRMKAFYRWAAQTFR